MIQKRNRRRGKKLSMKERAVIKAGQELGKSSYEMEKELGISHNTINKYLREQEAYNDPKMQQKVNQIKEREILDLTVLNIRAKARLHEIAPTANMIESIALMDRTFQQLRLLEGKSTQNIATLSKIIQDAHGGMFDEPRKPVAVDAETGKAAGDRN